jgi:hypothetical protein
MDISIYSGRISEEEYKEERQLEWNRMKDSGQLDKMKTKPFSIVGYITAYAWGTITLLTDLFLLALILIGQFTAR